MKRTCNIIKKVLLFSIMSCLLFVSSAYADPFYLNIKDELTWSLNNLSGSSAQGYYVSQYDDEFLGVIMGFDIEANYIFIIGEKANGKYECCQWDYWGYGFNNSRNIIDLIITDGIVDEISSETPITFMYKYIGRDWEVVYLEDEESAFALNSKLYGRD